MAILSFPDIAPNYLKTIQLPDYNTLVKEFDSGGEVRRSAQHTGVSTKLSLSYTLMSANDTATFINFWRATRGTWLSFTLPLSIIQHPDNLKIAIAKLDSTTYFRFSEALNFKTDYATLERGLYSFDVSIQSVVS
jgi:hypothetical protein